MTTKIPPTPKEQMLERAREDISRTELTNMLYDLSHVGELLVDGDGEGWRPTEITVGFDEQGYRDTGGVIDIMRAAGWRPTHVVFSPYNRITFEEIDG